MEHDTALFPIGDEGTSKNTATIAVAPLTPAPLPLPSLDLTAFATRLVRIGGTP